MKIFGSIERTDASAGLVRRVNGLLALWRTLIWSSLLLAPVVGWNVFVAVGGAALIMSVPLRLARMALGDEVPQLETVRC